MFGLLIWKWTKMFRKYHSVKGPVSGKSKQMWILPPNKCLREQTWKESLEKTLSERRRRKLKCIKHQLGGSHHYARYFRCASLCLSLSFCLSFCLFLCFSLLLFLSLVFIFTMFLRYNWHSITTHIWNVRLDEF